MSSPSAASSRTSSLTSQSSLLSTPSRTRYSLLVSPQAGLPSPRGSFSSPTRPQLMVFQSANHSLTSLPGSVHQKLMAEAAPAGGRRRSNLQPTTPLETLLPSAAALGAASALRSASRSPQGVRRAGLVSRPSPAKPLVVVQEETSPSKPSALTANQRLQQHLKHAARQGSLMTQHRETMSSVVFDPNAPQSVNLRRPPPPLLPQLRVLPPPEAPPAAAATPAAARPATRDQVTRSNTRRNSIQPPATPGLPVSSSVLTLDSALTTTTASAGVQKRVRFTGVPEYSEAEDAPTSYSSRILKNFAVFKTPSPSKPLKRKDHMFKTEESMLFRLLQSPDRFQLPPASANPIATTRLSKLKSKLM